MSLHYMSLIVGHMIELFKIIQFKLANYHNHGQSPMVPNGSFKSSALSALSALLRFSYMINPG